MTNLNNFKNLLTNEYIIRFAIDSSYNYSKTITTPEALAEKMTMALKSGSANKDSPAIKSVCKKCGIKTTWLAIESYLN
jgi:hypothetical protein